jgi:hypothetical protein
MSQRRADSSPGEVLPSLVCLSQIAKLRERRRYYTVMGRSIAEKKEVSIIDKLNVN